MTLNLAQTVNPFSAAMLILDEEANIIAEAYEELASDPQQQDEYKEGILATLQLMRKNVNSTSVNDSYLALYVIYKIATAVELI